MHAYRSGIRLSVQSYRRDREGASKAQGAAPASSRLRKNTLSIKYISMSRNIVVIGGGPAGLYFAILMKRADPAHRITVLERNRPDDTFGWGVVFSDQTLENFR